MNSLQKVVFSLFTLSYQGAYFLIQLPFEQRKFLSDASYLSFSSH